MVGVGEDNVGAGALRLIRAQPFKGGFGGAKNKRGRLDLSVGCLQVAQARAAFRALMSDLKVKVRIRRHSGFNLTQRFFFGKERRWRWQGLPCSEAPAQGIGMATVRYSRVA